MDQQGSEQGADTEGQIGPAGIGKDEGAGFDGIEKHRSEKEDKSQNQRKNDLLLCVQVQLFSGKGAYGRQTDRQQNGQLAEHQILVNGQIHQLLQKGDKVPDRTLPGQHVGALDKKIM